MESAPERVDAYLAALPHEQRAVLTALRAVIRRVAPDATEGIAYGMPALYSGGRFVVSYAAFKRHFSLFPASDRVREELRDELQGHFSGSGTLRFTIEQPLPEQVVEQIMRIRLEEVAGAAARG